MPEKTQINIVELTSDEEQAFDQPCVYANRCGTHSVYCHNEKAGYRKCYYRYCSARTHAENKCEGFSLNPIWDLNGEEEKRRQEEGN